MWKVSTDRDVNTAVNHTTNLLRRVFRASIRLHDCLTTSTIPNAVECTSRSKVTLAFNSSDIAYIIKNENTTLQL